MPRDVLVWLALAVAVIAVGLADYVLVSSVVLVVAAVLVRLGLTRFAKPVSATAWERIVAVVVVAGLGWRFVQGMPPTEWLVVEGMRNAALAMLAVPTSRKIGPIAMGLGLGLVLACSLLGEGAGVLAMAVLYAVLGAIWLSQRERESTATPWGAVAAVAIVAGTVGLFVHGSVRLDGLFAGLVNSSGGDGDGHDQARSGVGDGPDQIAGPTGDAGFDQSDFFCETDGQCLYDAFVENYGQPTTTSRVDRTQWLRLTEDQIGENREQDLRAGRSEDSPPRRFSLRRDRPSREASPEAVLWVEADRDQFPIRLPILAFDHYEPGEGHWHEEADEEVMRAMDHADEDGFFHPVDQPVGKVFGQEREVTIRTGTYDANILPLPNAMTMFRMGRVTKADVFASAAEPMLRINRTSVPPGSVFRVGYRPPVLDQLAAEPLAHGQADDTHHEIVASLAQQWAGHLPRGWQQIDAVVSRLRDHAVFEKSATLQAVEAAHDHVHACPVETFLHDTRRGDAHLFASSTVLMLRSLGYDARLAGGYYVSADDLDHATGQAAITRAHAHIWPQVRLELEAGYASSRVDHQQGMARGGQWIDLEPTPGFAVADGAPTFAQQATMTWSSLVAWAGREWPTLLIVGVAGAGIIVLRHRIADVVDVLVWRIRPTGDDRTFVLRTLGLLDRRARRRGSPRPVHQSHSSWLDSPDLSPVADWAMFSPTEAAPPSHGVDLFRRVGFKAHAR
ncbi:MAG: transglutaminase domain-containing protein [Planctomycetota bacterium]